MQNLYRLGVPGTQQHIPTQKFLKYLPWDYTLESKEG